MEKMASAAAYEYEALRQPDEIRLFQLSLSPDSDTDICGSIIHTTISKELNLSDCDTSYPSESPDCFCCEPYDPSDAYSLEGGYTALSYTWGNPEKSSVVYIDGKRLPITVNLDQVLRSLRLKTKSPRLWVDSICINQESDQERNHQVRQMCSIYKTATSTIIYLGPATALSTSCFKAAAAGPVMGSEIAQPRRWDLDPNALGLCYPELAKGRKEILGRSWFTRAWTFQELVVSRRPWICCGTTCMPWSQLCSYFLQERRWNLALGSDKRSFHDRYANCPMPDPWGLESAVYGRYSIAQDPDSQSLQVTTKGFMIMDKVRQIYHAGPETRVRKKDKYSLYTLLERRQGFAASDLRDSVFSLYGVLDQNDSAILRTPVDYQKSIVQTFTELAIALLCTDDGHDYALFTHVENGRNEIEGLPSWVPNWAAMRKYDRSIRNYILNWTPPLFGSREPEEKPSDFKIYKEDNAIVCRGHHLLSRIVKLSPSVQLKDRWMDDWSVKPRIFVDGSETLLVTSEEESRHGLPEIPRSNAGKNDVRHLIDRQAECIPGRRFALLEDDELALVPEQARVDDQICVLKDAKVFFTVRKAVDGVQDLALDRRVLDDFEGRISAVEHYNLIGECCKGDYKDMAKHAGPFDVGFMLH